MKNQRHYIKHLAMTLAVLGLNSWIILPSHSSSQPASDFTARSSSLARQPVSASTRSDEATQAHVREAYGKLPLSFEANRGQLDSQVKFLARGSGYSLFLTSNELVLALRKADRRTESQSANRRAEFSNRESSVLRMKLVGTNPSPQVTGLDELPGKSNYFIGNDSKRWRTNVSTYAKVKHEDVYPGVDMVSYGNGRQLEYDFVVAPGADPSRIKLAFAGAEKMRLDARGDLVLGVKGGEMRQHKPVVYQEVRGERKEIAGRYTIKGKKQIGFEVGSYDKSLPLVIDPILVYSTFLGGAGLDEGLGIALDATGHAYVTGTTSSMDFPTTSGAFDQSPNGDKDVFVTKLNPAGTALVYSTYLGGSGIEQARTGVGATLVGIGIALDGSGSAYLTGTTTSADFPTTPGAFDTSWNGSFDVFVTKINPAGTGLDYSTYIGPDFAAQGQGPTASYGFDIVVDSSGSAYVTGETGADVFVTKLNPLGTGLGYWTYVIHGGTEDGIAIALDASGSAYVTGIAGAGPGSIFHTLKRGEVWPTDKLDVFPNTAFVFGNQSTGLVNAFVMKLDPIGDLVYLTLLGGSGHDEGDAIAVDALGNAYVTGVTRSADFPISPGAFDTSFNGVIQDAFVLKLNPAGTELVYSTFLGGSGPDSESGLGIAIDASGAAYITGFTSSPDFPTTSGAFDTSWNGGRDAFVTELNPAGTALLYSTFLGGNSNDEAYGIALDPSGIAYLTGYTESHDFPTALDAFDRSLNGSHDAFVTKLEIGCLLPPVVTINGPPSGAIYSVNTPVPFTGTFSDEQGTHTATWMLDNMSQQGSVNETTGEVSLTYSFSAAGVYQVTLTVTDDCGGIGMANTIDGLTAMVVIYDPNGGFVTGGGWIDSPTGAYRPDPSLTGRANFGFVSKYQTGASVPTGETEFQFKVAGLNFHSSSYDWLVIAGARAQYKGTGTINGSGNYGFMLTAINGQINGGGGADKFRIKIWDKGTGDIIYDNQMGAGDNADPTTLLGGGSIVIHKGT